jgi:predicted transcriptional regulator
MSILLSIKPKYADKIVEGKKRYEFRKTKLDKTRVNYAYIYSTSPVKKIIGKIIIDDILEGNPKEIWDLCSKYSGISEDEYYKYFSDSKKAYALSIKHFEPLKKEIDPYIELDNFIPPQSFYYINEKNLFNKDTN